MINHPFLVRTISTFSATALAAALSLSQPAYAGDAQIAPPPSLAVKAYLLKDFNSGNVIATQNPSSQIGTFALPESQLDRFLMRI